jgi:hypothetical protein
LGWCRYVAHACFLVAGLCTCTTYGRDRPAPQTMNPTP